MTENLCKIDNEVHDEVSLCFFILAHSETAGLAALMQKVFNI